MLLLYNESTSQAIEGGIMRVARTLIVFVVGWFLGTWISVSLEPAFGVDWYVTDGGAMAITLNLPMILGAFLAWRFGWRKKR